MSSTKRLFGLIKEYKRRFSAFLLVGILQGLVGAGLVFLLREVISLLKDPSTIPSNLQRWLPTTVPYHALLFLIFSTFIIMLLKCLTMYLNRYLEGWLNNRVIMDMQNRLALHLVSLDFSFFQKLRSGEILSRLTNDLQLLSRSLRVLTVLITKPIEISFTLITIFILDWRLSLLGLTAIPLGGAVYALISKRMRQAARTAQQKRADITSALVQLLNGIRIVKAFTCEDFEVKNFRQETRRLYDASLRFDKAVSLIRPVNELVAVTGSLIVLAFGGTWVYSGELAPEDLIAFFGALAVMYAPAKDLGRVNGDLQEVLPGAERVLQLLDSKATILSGTIATIPENKTIEFKNVNFSYVEDIPVFNNLNLTIPMGKVVALVGKTGAGKSTLSDLLLRFHDPDSGTVTLGGIDLRSYDFSTLRNCMSLVSQDPFLFNSTIRENIAYGRNDVDQVKIEAAAKAAQIHDDILALEQGYDTIVGERGANLSGGQRQRIAIARAIFKDAPILILDEATSSLDAESELKIQQALDILLKNRTCLVIAHRLSTIKHADSIAILDKGQIVSQGKHEDIVNSCSIYSRFVNIQTGSF